MKPKPTFKVESLFDKEGEYTAICSALTGEILYHTGQEEKETEQETEEEKTNINQLKLF